MDYKQYEMYFLYPLWKKNAVLIETDFEKMISGDAVTSKALVFHKEIFWKGNWIFFLILNASLELPIYNFSSV